MKAISIRQSWVAAIISAVPGNGIAAARRHRRPRQSRRLRNEVRLTMVLWSVWVRARRRISAAVRTYEGRVGDLRGARKRVRGLIFVL